MNHSWGREGNIDHHNSSKAHPICKLVHITTALSEMACLALTCCLFRRNSNVRYYGYQIFDNAQGYFILRNSYVNWRDEYKSG